MSETYTTDSAESLAEALAKHRAGGYIATVDGHRECYCGHVFAADESYEWHVAQALIASGAVRREAEVRAEALRPIKALADEAMRRPIPGYISALQLRAALPEEGDR